MDSFWKVCFRVPCALIVVIALAAAVTRSADPSVALATAAVAALVYEAARMLQGKARERARRDATERELASMRHILPRNVVGRPSGPRERV